jgi:hypothetical protein
MIYSVNAQQRERLPVGQLSTDITSSGFLFADASKVLRATEHHLVGLARGIEGRRVALPVPTALMVIFDGSLRIERSRTHLVLGSCRHSSEPWGQQELAICEGLGIKGGYS